MTLFNMMKRSKPRSASAKSKTNHNNTDFKPKTANAKQNIDKYLMLARESLTIGDRVAAEGYYQHAEHYLRLMNEVKAKKAASEQIPTLNIPPKEEIRETTVDIAPQSVIASEEPVTQNFPLLHKR